VRVRVKPLIRLIWYGALVMALGGIIAISDRRYRQPARDEKRVKPAAAARPLGEH
jgi:cytochrome c-type biogenesis protein CcmF